MRTPSRSLQVAGRHGPADHKNTRPTALCVGAVRNGGPLRDSITAHSDIMVGFYEPRTTNCELRLFPRIQMRLCRVRFMIVLRPRAIRHKFRLGTGFTAAFLARQVPTSGRRKTAAKTDSCGWAARYEIWPYLFLYDGRFLRATSHYFSRAEGFPRRCRQFELVAA